MLLLLFIQLLIVSLLNLKIEIMNPDDYIEGAFDSNNPANQDEIGIETLEDDNLQYKLNNQIRATLYHKENCEKEEAFNMELCEKIALMKNDFKKLKDIEEMFTTFGKLTFEEQKQKDEILNKY